MLHADPISRRCGSNDCQAHLRRLPSCHGQDAVSLPLHRSSHVGVASLLYNLQTSGGAAFQHRRRLYFELTGRYK